MKIALCGNPNVGKTTLFNRLTGADAPVGNWHGVTVDVKTKRVSKTDMISDLPGAYSLTPRTAEESVTRDNVLFGDYDCILYVAEVNNLRRNLYMLLQIIEAGKSVALIVNMMDEARGKVSLDLLEKRLCIPVVGTSVKNKNPKQEVLSAAMRACKARAKQPDYLRMPKIVALSDKLAEKPNRIDLSPLFCAIKILEGDEYISDRLGVKNKADCNSCANCSGCDIDLPAKLRYEYIDKILFGVISGGGKISATTNKIDGIVLGKFALPIFFAVMTAVFIITFEAGKPLSNALVSLTELLIAPIESLSIPEWSISLLTDGVVAGVGGVLAFLPQVVILYLLTAILQDSGYMSRVAFVTDDFFKRFGLSGRAAFSVVLGLGCSASAVLTTRGISGDKARRRAAVITAFCPCSARLAVFTAITAYFSLSAFVVAAMYILGFLTALGVLKLFNTISPDKTHDSLIMEMPPYRVPGFKRVANVVLRNTLAFLGRVGSTVLGVSVIMWALCNFSVGYGYTGGTESSIMNTVSGMISPVFAPLGFGNWRAVAALISGIAAKETVISVISALGGMDAVFGSNIAAISFMIFTCLYVPCVATLSALVKETGIKYAALSVAIHTAAAYVASLLFYRSAVCYTSNKILLFSAWSCAIAVVIVFVLCRKLKTVRLRKRYSGKNYGKKI